MMQTFREPMNDKTTTLRPTPVLFIVLFAVAAAALGYVALHHGKDYVTLNVNNDWRIYLTGEDRVSAVATRSMRVLDHNSRELSLQGFGEIRWGQNLIQVHKAGVYFNNKLFSKSQREPRVDIVLSPDGKVHRGTPGKQP